MSHKLNFANVSEAYNIASEQIKNRQDQIDKLKKIINENSTVNNQTKDPNAQDKVPGILPQVPVQPVQPVQMNNTHAPSEDFEYSFYKLAGNQKFDQAVQNYLILKQPGWFKNMCTPIMSTLTNIPTNPMNQMSKSSFGNIDSTDIKHYIIFFIFSVIIYLMLGILIKN